MGLDMYMVKAKKGHDVEKLYRDFNNLKVKDIAYWRKANAVHNWIIQNVAKGVDDCKPVLMTKADVEKLFEVTNAAHNAMTNGENTADLLLPTKEGFFFGSTAYDEWYVTALEQTLEQLNTILNGLVDFETEDLYYIASW